MEKTTNSASAPAQAINPANDYEIRYWAARFLCSQEQLRKAIAAAGPSPDKVRKYLLAQRRYF
jgi:hypothetical protein